MIVHYKESHPDVSHYSIAKYFKEMGISESTTYSILARYEECGSIDRASGSGRPAELMGPKNRQRLVHEAISTDFPSETRFALKYGISQPYVSKILSEEGVHSFKKTKSPCTSDVQQKTQKVRIDRLYRLILDKNVASVAVVMDDESYFEMNATQLPGNDHYFSYCKDTATTSQKLAPKAKFPPKIMMWIAISDRGISHPYFVPSTGALTSHLYQTKCVTQRLKPFLDTYHVDGEYLFWPDLASCHYAKNTVKLLEELEINFVSKEMNPPCCPQLRPIEDFWGILKQLVYEKGWQAENLDQLKRRIKYCLTKVDLSVVHEMMLHVKSHIRKARASGVSSMVH